MWTMLTLLVAVATCPDGAKRETRPRDGGTEVVCRRADGTLDGAYERRDAAGVVRESGAYHAGRRSGTWSFFFTTGRIEERGAMIGEDRDGAWEIFFPDGKPRGREGWKLGKRHGLTETFYPTGKPNESAAWADGIQHGESLTWCEDGRLWRWARYENGVEVEARPAAPGPVCEPGKPGVERPR